LIGRRPHFAGRLFVLRATLLGATVEHRSGAVETPCPAGAPAEIHYAPAEDLETIDVAMIREAKSQIDMAAYLLTDRTVVDALRQAADRGVRRCGSGATRTWRRGWATPT
jgi:phosphatidylserine/phosphatidylglycerophosphate/cardiolipin synthase-like enzyme